MESSRENSSITVITQTNIEMKEIFVIDATGLLFRSYYAIRQMTNKEGVSTNGLFGFIRSLLKLKKDFSPTHLVCVFDGPNNKASRVEIYADYKGHREGMPEDLVPQIDLAKRFCKAQGIPQLEIDGVEADDTMGAIAKWAERNTAKVFLCSSDKDLCQLINDRIVMLQPYNDNLIIDTKGVIEKFGVRPDQIVDYLAIVGDASDNIPGIKGFGAKTAAELLSEFGTLEEILNHPEKQKSPKRAEKITQERDNALLSKQLATLDIHVKIPQESAAYCVEQPNIEELKSLYEEMNFNTLLSELKVAPAAPKKSDNTHFRLVNSEEELVRELKKIDSAKEVSIDTETTSTDPMSAKLVGIGFCATVGDAFYVPFNGNIDPKVILQHVKRFTESKDRSYIGHNIKYDMHILKRNGIELKTIGFDTMIASYTLNAGANRHSLDRLVLETFDHKMVTFDELTGKKTLEEIPLEEVAQYCCEDASYTLRLKDHFEKELKKRNLTTLFSELEMPLLPILFKMEHAGIYVDEKELHLLSKEFRVKIDHLQEKIFQIAKDTCNLNSPKQLGELLFVKLGIKPAGKKTKTGYSTSAEVLEQLIGQHPIIELILAYRTLEKLRSTYIDSLGTQINPVTRRIHSSFNQSVTATGRLSCTNPNLQNIPIRSEDGKRIRSAFRPQKDNWSFVAADYSQIELRILAHLSGDPNLTFAFKHGKDIHTTTAAQVFGIKEEEVTSTMRHQAKAVNFGLIYGQSSFGLSKELGISVSDASKFIERYFAQYPSVKDFLESCKEKAQKEGKATSMFGRERLLPEINSRNGMLRSQALRFAVNTPIQGTQADIIKKAMIDIDRYYLNHKSHAFCVLQIHDELIFECPDAELEPFSKNIAHLMEETIKLSVPLKVDISIGKNWGEC